MTISMEWSKLTVVLKSGDSYEVYGDHKELCRVLQHYQEHPFASPEIGGALWVIQGKMKTPLVVDRWITVLRSEVAGMVLEECPQFTWAEPLPESENGGTCPECNGVGRVKNPNVNGMLWIRCPKCNGKR